MNDPSAGRRSERRSGGRHSENSEHRGRCASRRYSTVSPPRLTVVVELEELPVISIDAASAEDEARLVAWLGRAGARQRLQQRIEDVLDEFRAAA